MSIAGTAKQIGLTVRVGLVLELVGMTYFAAVAIGLALWEGSPRDGIYPEDTGIIVARITGVGIAYLGLAATLLASIYYLGEGRKQLRPRRRWLRLVRLAPSAAAALHAILAVILIAEFAQSPSAVVLVASIGALLIGCCLWYVETIK